MRTFCAIWAALLLFTLGACSGSHPVPETMTPKEAAHFVYFVDISSSPATMNSPVVAQAVERRISDDLTKNLQLGDSITFYEAGARTADRMVAHPSIVTDYNLRLPIARSRVIQQFREIGEHFHAQGGDSGTNLLLSLEAVRPQCSRRATVTLITDGVEEGDTYSAARALAAGKPVNLPAPPGKYLAGGCKVVFLGFGLTAGVGGTQQLLPAQPLAALRRGWTDYLEAAGVSPDNIEFVSAL